MRTYWLVLAISDEDLAKEMNVNPDEIEGGDYIGAIRDFAEIVKLEVEDEPNNCGNTKMSCKDCPGDCTTDAFGCYC